MKPKLYWVRGPWPGRLAIVPRPRGDDWLEDEMHALKASGVDTVVSLLTDEETGDLSLGEEATASRAAGIQFVSFPIEDRATPPSRNEMAELLDQLGKQLAAGKNVAVHCRQGIGRSALVAACLLILAGLDAEEAISRVSEARGCPVPETPEQREWVVDFSKSLASVAI